MKVKYDFKEIEKLFTLLKSDINTTKVEIKAVNAHNSRIETKLSEMDEKFEKNLTKWKNDICNKIDPILSRVKTAEEENTILSARNEGRHEERQLLEERVKKLETIHPQYRHQSL